MSDFARGAAAISMYAFDGGNAIYSSEWRVDMELASLLVYCLRAFGIHIGAGLVCFRWKQRGLFYVLWNISILLVGHKINIIIHSEQCKIIL